VRSKSYYQSIKEDGIIINMKIKKCSLCQIEKPVEEFFKTKYSKDGYGKCKQCMNDRNKKIRQINSTNNKLNTTITEVTEITCYKCNMTKVINEFSIDRCKKNAHRNICKACELCKSNQYSRKRRKTDEGFRIKCNLRNRMWSSLKKNLKSAHTLELIGLPSIELLLKWLNFNKSAKVTDNEPVVDHLIPCASFDLSKEEDQRKCFNWKNLRYMNAIDNLKKRDTYPDISEILVQEAMVHAFTELVLKS
jgi:hypothetical protein